MKKLLISAAIILGLSQAAQAVDNETILKKIEEIKDAHALCTLLGKLPHEDKVRLQEIATGEAKDEAAKKIRKIVDEGGLMGPLSVCIQRLVTKDEPKYDW